MIDLIKQYEIALTALKKEASHFEGKEKLLWISKTGVTNSCGNLLLHLIGNLNHFIGANMGNSTYVRNRELEFSSGDIPLKSIIKDIDSLIKVIPEILKTKTNEWKTEIFSLEFLGEKRSNEFMLVYLLGHLNYHLGQLNYLRRILENQ